MYLTIPRNLITPAKDSIARISNGWEHKVITSFGTVARRSKTAQPYEYLAILVSEGKIIGQTFSASLAGLSQRVGPWMNSKGMDFYCYQLQLHKDKDQGTELSQEKVEVEHEDEVALLATEQLSPRERNKSLVRKIQLALTLYSFRFYLKGRRNQCVGVLEVLKKDDQPLTHFLEWNDIYGITHTSKAFVDSEGQEIGVGSHNIKGLLQPGLDYVALRAFGDWLPAFMSLHTSGRVATGQDLLNFLDRF